ncbi:hypothetical protein OIU76_004467 [Salix suchowensis]|nr:hypothetical protein OIU76_004467 [Salix suchowensis]
MLKSDANSMNPIVQVDGDFADIDQVLVIDNNNAIGMTVKSTVGKLTVPGNGQNGWRTFHPYQYSQIGLIISSTLSIFKVVLRHSQRME